jgi:hypothetical protein
VLIIPPRIIRARRNRVGLSRDEYRRIDRTVDRESWLVVFGLAAMFVTWCALFGVISWGMQ